ncbi:unnamed protein product [Anisakis simplex]|uniref:Cell wall protein DAN4-like n=1 Tax=Anisakis simplex TaxID=6269 RepID=A0A0M3JXD9_ANISI|nr:unnamed protein product [Anisakis simplex]
MINFDTLLVCQISISIACHQLPQLATTSLASPPIAVTYQQIQTSLHAMLHQQWHRPPQPYQTQQSSHYTKMSMVTTTPPTSIIIKTIPTITKSATTKSAIPKATIVATKLISTTTMRRITTPATTTAPTTAVTATATTSTTTTPSTTTTSTTTSTPTATMTTTKPITPAKTAITEAPTSAPVKATTTRAKSTSTTISVYPLTAKTESISPRPLILSSTGSDLFEVINSRATTSESLVPSQTIRSATQNGKPL